MVFGILLGDSNVRPSWKASVGLPLELSDIVYRRATAAYKSHCQSRPTIRKSIRCEIQAIFIQISNCVVENGCEVKFTYEGLSGSPIQLVYLRLVSAPSNSWLSSWCIALYRGKGGLSFPGAVTANICWLVLILRCRGGISTVVHDNHHISIQRQVWTFESQTQLYKHTSQCNWPCVLLTWVP